MASVLVVPVRGSRQVMGRSLQPLCPGGMRPWHKWLSSLVLDAFRAAPGALLGWR